MFDWAWAEAYEHHGLDYYPKWVNAIPFTPVQGPRIGITPELENIEQTRIGELMLRALDQRLMHGTGEIQISSWHSLFVAPAQMPLFGASSTQLVKRLGTQFHWYNRDYRNFDDFLSRFSSRKRKNILKERAQLQPFGLKFEFVEGERVTELQWQTFIQCYQLTYLKRSGHRGYLTPTFFHQLGQLLAAQILLLVVKDAKGEMIAGALYFKGKNPKIRSAFMAAIGAQRSNSTAYTLKPAITKAFNTVLHINSIYLMRARRVSIRCCVALSP